MVDVDLVENALPPGLLEPRDELGAQDVDLPVDRLNEVNGVSRTVITPALMDRRQPPTT